MTRLRTRKNLTKKLSLQIVNEDFEEDFDAVIRQVIVPEEIFRSLDRNR